MRTEGNACTPLFLIQLTYQRSTEVYASLKFFFKSHFFLQHEALTLHILIFAAEHLPSTVIEACSPSCTALPSTLNNRRSAPRRVGHWGMGVWSWPPVQLHTCSLTLGSTTTTTSQPCRSRSPSSSVPRRSGSIWCHDALHARDGIVQILHVVLN